MHMCLKMKGYIDNLERLGAKVDDGMAIDLILGSLPPNFEQFIMNYQYARHEQDYHSTPWYAQSRRREHEVKCWQECSHGPQRQAHEEKV